MAQTFLDPEENTFSCLMGPDCQHSMTVFSISLSNSEPGPCIAWGGGGGGIGPHWEN